MSARLLKLVPSNSRFGEPADEALDPIGFAADYLFALRTEKRIELGIPAACRPANFRSAYAIQDRLIEKLLASAPGSRRLGYKISCASDEACSFLSLRPHPRTEPFFGRILSQTALLSPARLASEGYFTHGIHATLSFVVTKDIPPGFGPHSIETIADYIGAIVPSIDVIETRFADWTKVGACQLVADNALHGAWVQGPLTSDWGGLNFEQQAVALRVNGRTVREMKGKSVLGNPLYALTWLANALNSSGDTLEAGQLVSTGALTELYIARPGERIEADFGSLGVAELTVVP